MALQQGELVEWDDDRGFGFIRPDGAGERLFVHISQLGRLADRPRIGDRLNFVAGTGRDGRPAAVKVSIAGASRDADPVSAPAIRYLRFYVAFALLAGVLLALALGRAPDWLAAAYLGFGLLSALLYFRDKSFAEKGAWRTPETTLHSIDLACGIIGGLLAQEVFRHKTAKQPFIAVSYVIAALHALFLLALLSGRIALPELVSLIPV